MDRGTSRLTKYRQNAGVRTFAFEVVPYLFRRRSVYNCGQSIRRSLPDPAHASEVFNQALPRPWPWKAIAAATGAAWRVARQQANPGGSWWSLPTAWFM